jgi:hypothetical protein
MVKDPCRVAVGLSQRKREGVYITARIWKTLSYKAKSELMEGLIEFLKVKSKCIRRRRF